MQPLLSRLLLSHWVLTGIGALLLALLAWFLLPLGGTLWPPLEGWLFRAAVVVVIALSWLGGNWWLRRRRMRAEAALTAGVAGAALDEAGEEATALRARLAAALATLKKARGTRGYLNEQPWYVIIGPPGAGKTTALINSGLKFPLAAELGQGAATGAGPLASVGAGAGPGRAAATEAVAGVGGTRLCDWWFADEAVLIDTAGRYTTQDSDARVDRSGWEAFLDLLRQTRARQPLNGVLVAISVADIAANPGEARAHAQAIRARIKELTERLRVRLPVYALLTKADLIAGFTEFFDDLDRERREQVWGMTFPVAAAGTAAVGQFAEEFACLVARLNERLFPRLQAERSPERRALIAGFPAQAASFGEPLAEFLTAAFGGSRLDPAPLLRGVYLASGTQEGTPIDRLTGVLAQAFGIDQRRTPSLAARQGRSYFLGRLLRQVVFGEAMLASEPPGRARRRMLLRACAFAAVLLLTGGAALALWTAGSAAAADAGRFDAALLAYEQAAATLPLDPVAEGDLARIAPLLDQAEALQPVAGGGSASPFSHAGLSQVGLSQSGTLAAAGRAVYRHALERVLLPRLTWRLEAQMRGGLNRPDFLYEATRVYLMLGGQGPLDQDLVREWMALDWAGAYPGAVRAPLRDSLARHLGALLANPLPAIALDGALVESARRTFSRVSLAERVYSRLRPSAAARRLPAWTPADSLGALGVRVFVRPSGKALTEGLPGFYTVEGFHHVLLPGLAPTVRDVLGESWVLGSRVPPGQDDPALATIEPDVVALYAADYGRAWDAMLADLAVVPLRSLQQAEQDLYVLASPQSPMRDLLASLARQLTLSEPPPAPQGATAPGAKGEGAKAEGAASPAARLAGLMGPAATSPPGQVIDERYKALRDYVGRGPGAPIDLTLKLLNDLQQQISALAHAAAGAPGSAAPAAPGPDPGQLLRAEAYRQPPPVSGWLQTLAAGGDRLRGAGAKQQAATAFNGAAGPAPLCKKAVEGRYPFKAGAQQEIPLDDFGKLFAPGGMIDAFFSQQLRAFVDQSASGWKLQPVAGVEPPVSEAQLAQFQRAALIRDLFFGAGGATPAVRFDITPLEADPGTKQVTLDLNGIAVIYTQGPSRATQVAWPGVPGPGAVRLVFDPPPSSGPPVIQATGPWALFRVFDQGTLTQGGGPEEYRLSFRLADRTAVFQIRAGSVNNPFGPGVLHAFSCPLL